MRTTPAHGGGGSGAADTGDTARKHRRGAAGLAVAALLAAAAVAGCASGGSSATGAGAPQSTGAPGTTPAGPSGGSASPSGTGPGSATGVSGVGGTTQCQGGALHTTSASAGVASGHVGLILTFTNTGSAACTLTGYPGAALVGANAQVVMNATRTLSGFLGGAQGYSAAPSVTLAPGAPASALLEWVDVPTGNGAPAGANCPGMGADHLLVTPPDTTATVSLPPPGMACGGLEIHPVLAGSTGRTPGT